MERIYGQWLLAIGAAVAVILLVVNVQLTFSNTRQLAESNAWVVHSHAVMDGLTNLLSSMKDAETGQRGYLITGQPGYLEPYDIAVASVNGQLESLQGLIADNDRQQVRMPLVRERVARRLQLLADNIALRRDKGMEAARLSIMSDAGKVEMDALRTVIGTMLDEEKVLLEQRVEQAQRNYWWAIITGLTSGALALLGMVAFIVVLQRHMNARALAAAELFQQRELLRITLASIGDAIITTDTAGRITYLNAVSEGLTGWANAEAAGKPLEAVFNIVNEETRKTVENPAMRSLREGIIVGLANHTVLIAKDGREHPIDDSASPIRDEENNIVGCVLVYRDVTQRRDTEERLRKSEERYDLAVKGSNEGVWDWNIQTGSVYFSDRCLAMLGYAPNEVSSAQETWRKGIHPDDWQRVRQSLQRHLKDRVPYDVEFRKLDKFGEYRWFRSRGEAVRNAWGEPTRMAGSVTDVTDRKILEEQVRQRVDQLAEGDRRKDEFLATLAHELRNPLAPLSNALAILKAAGDNPQTFQKTREIMERQLGQMVRLIDDLLDVSRISRGKIDLRLESIDLSSVIHQALEICKPLSDKAAHRLEIELPAQPVYINADAVRMAQVFCNLLSNAFKFTPPNGHIRLAARSQGNEVVVTIKDSGVGIPTNKLSDIFELFTQLDRTLERSQSGLGIGLTLVQRLVTMHGGLVLAQSDGEGTGSEFVVRLPLHPDQTPRAAAGMDAGASGGGTPKFRNRVLVVDDNQDSANSLAILLKFAGNEVETANDGVEAVSEAQRFRPDMILLDIGMPRLNGYDAARRIREQAWGKDIMLVALTGWGQEEDRRKSRDAGFDEHLVKPVDHDTLM
ncbi:MAG TPA: CHASE3 domain-containing protein, partial [Burkholderiales bacterium]